MTALNRPLRWHVVIRNCLTSAETDFDEISYLNEIVEAGPDWAAPDYEIKITYNDPFGLHESDGPGRPEARQGNGILSR